MGKMSPKTIDVICQHTKDGEIIPMRIRVTDEDGVYQIFTIKEYRELPRTGTHTTPDGISVCNNTLVFECKIIVFGQTRSIRLYYDIKQTLWKIAV